MILGIDEVGRGPWAGPLVVGAVVLGGVTIEGLTDSKKLSKKRREELDIIIRQKASGYGLGWVSAHEIDQIGLSAALVLATKRAVQHISAPYHEIIIDGTVNFLQGTSKGAFVTTLKKADLLIPSVSAASIIAKVARDAYMSQQDDVYPGYRFASHVGYGTAVHRAAIEQLGVTPLHRLSFAPLAKYKASPSISSAKKQRAVRQAFSSVASLSNKVDASSVMTTKSIGDAGEAAATQHLVHLGHQIIDRNWKTKFCEIDIVSIKDDVVYFAEVKYRKQSRQGGGLAAITPRKLRQMKFAAELYALKNKLNDTDMRLLAIAVTGSPAVVETSLEIV